MKIAFKTPLLLTALSITTIAFSQDRPNRSRPGDLRMADTLKAGDPAPDFTLKSKDGKEEVTLSKFKGKLPVVLIFGSYT